MLLKRLALAALLPLAACATGGVSLSHQEVDTAYSPGEFAYAGAGRDLRVDVVGNPFGGDRAAFAAAVTDAMQGRHWGQRTNFTTTPGETARPKYRVLMLFDPPVSLNAMRLCPEQPSALPTVAAGDEVVLFAAFCRDGKSLTSIKGRVSGVAGARDPIFRELVGGVTNGLFPPERSRQRGNRCPPWVKC